MSFPGTVATALPWPSQQAATCTSGALLTSSQRCRGGPCGAAAVQDSQNCSSSSSRRSRLHRTQPGSHAPLSALLLLLLLSSLALPPAVMCRRLLRAPHRRLAADRTSDSTAAAQQPCMPCNRCVTPGCYNICSNSCRSYPAPGFPGMGGGGFPGGGFPGGYDPAQCKQEGSDIADGVADQACKGAQLMCQAGSKQASYALSESRVSASQCAAQANAACQKGALASSQTPCGANLYFGFRSCSGRQFNDLYRSYVSDGCQAATSRF